MKSRLLRACPIANLKTWELFRILQEFFSRTKANNLASGRLTKDVHHVSSKRLSTKRLDEFGSLRWVYMIHLVDIANTELTASMLINIRIGNVDMAHHYISTSTSTLINLVSHTRRLEIESSYCGQRTSGPGASCHDSSCLNKPTKLELRCATAA